MASENTSYSTLVMESDVLENSMGREPQGIMEYQSSQSKLLKYVPQKFRWVLPGLRHDVVQEFQACLSYFNCDRLLEMVKEFPPQLFLQTFDEEFSRSALHVAVLEGSQTLIRAMVEKLKALFGGNDSKLDEHDFVLKEDCFGLSAIDMAALIGNKEIISCFEHHLKVFDYHQGGNVFLRSPTSKNEKKYLLENASPLLKKQAPTSSYQGIGQLSIQEWLHMNNVDFIYCLHKAGDILSPSQKKAFEFVKLVRDMRDFSFLEPLFNVRDGLGKSPLHVSNDDDFIEELFHMFDTHFPNLDWNMRDFSGRTPLHWAAAQGCKFVVTFLANRGNTNLNANYSNTEDKIEIQKTNFNNDKFEDMTPLHLAVFHNHVEVVKALLKVSKHRGLNVNAICWLQYQYLDDPSKPKVKRSWTPMQLAAYLGHEQILEAFLKDSRLDDLGLKNGKKNAPTVDNGIPALHLAASQFRLSTLKTLLDCRKMDMSVKDKLYGNTALHSATMDAHGCLQVYASLQNYVTVSQFERKPPKSRKPSDDNIITCIDILMQLGLDMEQKNKDGITPTLHPSCPEKVQNWWLEKMAKEAQENKNSLIIASNAVSVTAALVATASFVGPLQPPLGLLDDGNQTWLDGYSQVKHTSVQVFLFCDSLSFYLAIAAIVFSMLPSWPIPHESLAQEVRIARRCVQVAVLLLFGSIIFVVCAFSAASVAIVPDQRWQYKTIAVISTSLGVLICFLVLFLSFMRLLTLFSSRSKVAEKISNVATRIMLWEEDTSTK